MSADPEALNCTVPADGIAPFKADPDIAGIGVIVAFLIPAWVSLMLAIFLYLAALGASSSTQVSPPDNLEALRETVVMLSDQQLVVGTAMQVVAFSRHRETSQYHTSIIYYLTWIASNTHQACLLTVEDRLLEHAGMRIWRLLWMLLLDLMLIPTAILVFGSSWLSAYGLSTDCGWQAFGRIDYSRDMFSLFLTLALGAWSIMYIVSLLVPTWLWKRVLPLKKAMQLWEAVSKYVIKCFNRTDGRLSWTLSGKSTRSQASLDGTKSSTTLEVLLLTAALNLERLLLVIVFIVWEIARSTILALARVLLALIMFTAWLEDIRRQAPHEGLEEGEGRWGFGQILPLLFLACLYLLCLISLRKLLVGSLVPSFSYCAS